MKKYNKFKLCHIPHYLRKWLHLKPRGKWFVCMATSLERDEYGWNNGIMDLAGFYNSKKLAIYALNSNTYDMRDCLYNYAILEYICDGSYGYSRDECYNLKFAYKWNEKARGFYASPEDDEKLSGRMGFGF